MRRTLMTSWKPMASLVFALALMVSMVGVAAAHHQDDHERGNGGQACDNAENPPDWCDEDDTPEQEDPETACTAEDKDGYDGTGVASGIVEQVRQGAADGGAPAELTDGVDTLNCEVIVTVEQALEGDGEDGDEDEDDNEGGDEGDPLADGCDTLVDELSSNASEEFEQARAICDAAGDGEEDEGEGEEGNPLADGCNTLVDELSNNASEEFEQARALCDEAEAIPAP